MSTPADLQIAATERTPEIQLSASNVRISAQRDRVFQERDRSFQKYRDR